MAWTQARLYSQAPLNSATSLLHESHPSGRLALALQQLPSLEFNGLAFAFTQLMHELQVES